MMMKIDIVSCLKHIKSCVRKPHNYNIQIISIKGENKWLESRLKQVEKENENLKN